MNKTDTALILADLEGIYDVYDLEDITACQRAYCEELKVYIDALLHRGIGRIYVCDAHDQGNLLTDLPKICDNDNIQVISTVAAIDFDIRYDFAMLVGFHGMSGSPGILPHSLRYNFKQLSVFSKNFNVHLPIGEVELYTRWLGSKGIPVFFVSGDREAVYEANCFNPYRETCCVKSLFEEEKTDREPVFRKIRSSIDAAFTLDFSRCLSSDDDPIHLTFTHEDLFEELLKSGYPVKDDGIVYESCSAFVENLYPLVEIFIAFDRKNMAENRRFLKELRTMTSSLDKASFQDSEMGKLLSGHTLYSMNRKIREEVRARFSKE